MATTKIAEGYFKVTQTEYPTEGVKADLVIDKIDGEWLDTSVELSGGFCIAYANMREFMDAFGGLVDKYRI
jgi:hypothetical protein